MTSGQAPNREARRAAMDLLARREHSRQELLDKLCRRFEQPLAKAAVEGLRADGLQCDRRFAEAYVRQRSQRGYGPLRIRQELRQRGVDDTDVAAAFDNNELDWHVLLADLIERKYGSLAARDIKEKARRQRFLQYRGFSPDQIRTLLQ